MSHTQGPYTVGKESWDGTEYWTIQDAEGTVVCMEPTDFFAYPEGPFIEPRGKPGVAEMLVRVLNSHQDLLDFCRAAREAFSVKMDGSPYIPNGPETDALWAQLKAVIAKAEGRTA